MELTKTEECGINTFDFRTENVISRIPPWIFPEPKVNLDIIKKIKEWLENGKENICNLVQEFMNKKYYGYLEIYTDGSKDPGNGHVGVGIAIPEFKVRFNKRIPNHVSIYMAELVAASLGLQWVEEVKPDRVVIYSDTILNTSKTTRDDILIEIYSVLLNLEIL